MILPKNIIFRNLAHLLCIFTLASCVEYKIINIQTLKPAEVSALSDFSSAVAVASIYKGIEGSGESMAQAAIDSTAAVEAVFALSESLYDSPLLQGTIIPTRLFVRDDVSKYILPFSWETIDGLAVEDNADIVISLEYIKIKPVKESFSYWDGYSTKHYGALTTNIYCYWRIYDVKKREVITNHLHQDTLTWDYTDYVKVNVGDQLPGFFSASMYAGYYAGNEFAKLIAPSWMDEQRLYYTKGSKEMKKAVEHVQENHWMDAAKQWQIIIKNPRANAELVAKAAFNMALANEMNGNFEAALEWLDKSQDYFPISSQLWYQKILELRMKVMEKL